MGLTAYNAQILSSWTLSKTNTPLANTVYGPDNLNLTQTLSSVDMVTFTEVLVSSVTLAASATQDYNFNSFTDQAGNAVTITKALSMIITTSGPSTATCKLTASPANGLSWFLSGTTPAINIPAGAAFAFIMPQALTPQVVSAGAGSMRVQNSGTGSLVVNISVLLGP